MAKEHVKKIKKSDFNRQRASTSTLRNNCSRGFIFTRGGKSKKQSAFHHILAISSLQDASIEPQDKLQFFHDCMAATKWDINHEPNLIGLPLKSVYARADLNPIKMDPFKAALAGKFGTIPDLPCHQVEHDDYNLRQVEDLITNVWMNMLREQKPCNIDGVRIQEQLEEHTTVWKDFLEERGQDPKKASDCWIHRNDPTYRTFWYKPFSMNPDGARKAEPPPPVTSAGKIASFLETLFIR